MSQIDQAFEGAGAKGAKSEGNVPDESPSSALPPATEEAPAGGTSGPLPSAETRPVIPRCEAPSPPPRPQSSLESAGSVGPSDVTFEREVDVDDGGTVVGTFTGGSGSVTVGGRQVRGDEIDTGSGAYIGGGVQAGRDLAGRDLETHVDRDFDDKIEAKGETINIFMGTAEIPRMPQPATPPAPRAPLTSLGRGRLGLIIPALLVGVLAVAGIGALVRSPVCREKVDPVLEKVWSRDQLGCPTEQSKDVWSAWQLFERGYMIWVWPKSFYVLEWQDGINPDAGTWQTNEEWECVGECPALPTPRPTPPPDLREPKSGFGHVFFRYVLEGNQSPIGWAKEDQKGFCARIQKFEHGLIVASAGEVRCRGDDGNEGALDLDFVLVMNYSGTDEESGRFLKETP
jgi:hypothetical protein